MHLLLIYASSVAKKGRERGCFVRMCSSVNMKLNNLLLLDKQKIMNTCGYPSVFIFDTVDSLRENCKDFSSAFVLLNSIKHLKRFSVLTRDTFLYTFFLYTFSYHSCAGSIYFFPLYSFTLALHLWLNCIMSTSAFRPTYKHFHTCWVCLCEDWRRCKGECECQCCGTSW